MACALLLSACATPPRNTPPDPQQRAAHDRLFTGCMEQRLFDNLDEYLDKGMAFTQIGPLRYEGFTCECLANAAAQRPYVTAILARMNHGEELNDAGDRILKTETLAALLQCTSAWLDKSAAAMVEHLDP